jgi:sulfite reductase alpha subunit
VNSVHRSDFSVIGTWRDDMKVNQEEVKAYVEKVGRKYMIDSVISMCPTRALSLNDDDTLEVDNHSCVRCMHCLNVMTKALSPGDDTGATILIGGKRALKVGDLMGTVIVPFFRLQSDEDYEKLTEFAGEVVEFFADNALEHERVGETIDRIGLPAFLEAMGIEADPNMVNHPRTSSYVRTDDFTEEAEKYFERKKEEQSEKAATVAAE